MTDEERTTADRLREAIASPDVPEELDQERRPGVRYRGLLLAVVLAITGAYLLAAVDLVRTETIGDRADTAVELIEAERITAAAELERAAVERKAIEAELARITALEAEVDAKLAEVHAKLGELEERMAELASAEEAASRSSSPRSSVTTVAARSASAPAPSGDLSAMLDRLAHCETGGTMDPAIHNPTGRYHGLLQFDLSTWATVKAPEDPDDPHLASPAAQMAAGARLYHARGWAPWPACSRKLGYR